MIHDDSNGHPYRPQNRRDGTGSNKNSSALYDFYRKNSSVVILG